MKQIFLIFSLVFAPLAPVFAAAASTPTPNTYDVEVVVFLNQMPDLEGGEIWRNNPVLPASPDMNQAVAIGEAPAPDAFLSPAAAALEKSGRHHVLAHLHWQQTADAKSVSKPVIINGPNGQLAGTLRFYLSRYLLVDLNLSLQGEPSAGLFGLAGQATPVIYHLNEYRRVRLLETHYFDHPKFGALVRVSPIKSN
ncbi:MAG: CsiV family protein [Sulfuricaulis sp.]